MDLIEGFSKDNFERVGLFAECERGKIIYYQEEFKIDNKKGG
ncbi:MAG: hypothetical protein SBU_001339 [Candidatus Syntrophoarchaeum butanivorans]|uniref:Uncharacterized protein n=1 Tax=Candidatus Syntropharchaeum butanivorans TaxID=1839936 RepID=A0A1F2P4X4_9EURY|nr:MAG: hypothetical protein SBU_001339 [Candidatus Syntrophoarchaeum butanivorans]